MLAGEEGKVGVAALGRERGRGLRGAHSPVLAGLHAKGHPAGTAALVHKAQNELCSPFLGAVLSPGGVCV